MCSKCIFKVTISWYQHSGGQRTIRSRRNLFLTNWLVAAVIRVLRFHRLRFHYTVYHFAVSGSCVGLARETFVLFQESLWSHCCKAILSVVECYTVLCIVVGNHWRHQLHFCRLSLTAVSPQLPVDYSLCSCCHWCKWLSSLCVSSASLVRNMYSLVCVVILEFLCL